MENIGYDFVWDFRHFLKVFFEVGEKEIVAAAEMFVGLPLSRGEERVDSWKVSNHT